MEIGSVGRSQVLRTMCQSYVQRIKFAFVAECKALGPLAFTLGQLDDYTWLSGCDLALGVLVTMVLSD